MSTDLHALITTADKNAQYDTQAKKLLGRKIILAHILINTIDEFKDAGRTIPDYCQHRVAERRTEEISYIKSWDLLCLPDDLITKRQRFP